jgi:hypothetical protein
MDPGDKPRDDIVIAPSLSLLTGDRRDPLASYEYVREISA